MELPEAMGWQLELGAAMAGRNMTQACSTWKHVEHQ